jgi:hypothetical protein
MGIALPRARLLSVLTSSSCGSGVDDDGQCDDGEFKLDTAPVSGCRSSSGAQGGTASEGPLLSGLQVPAAEWQDDHRRQELAVDGRAGGSGEICVKEH